jgi:surfactin synthase thioesterase subunit/3-oxoacyl-(acyl-carrier-protein) synthase
MTNDTTTLQKALLAIQKLKRMVQDKKSDTPVAIVGMGCRFSQADNLQQFWELLQKGKDTVVTIPAKRWELLKDTDELLSREQHQYFGSYLSDITGFDAYFFGITPREALRMDPQQRLLLEVAYETFQDAGQTIETLAGSNTGVFTSLYANPLGYYQKILSEMDALYIPTGNAISIAANRLSYLFDLRGPSMVLDTACSSTLVGIHLACLHIQNKLCDAALVAGVNINLIPSVNALLHKAKMLSPDGKCHTFDACANGYVQGEGAGAIFLKPLAKALQDKDRIYAVIMGSAVNQDGKTNGLTAPSGMQQEALLKSVYTAANINPSTVGYVECHGTGTFLGDPIEVQALGEVVGNNRAKGHPCWIGSVKTNIGHLEPAAGIASVIKVALGLQKGEIPPHLNFSKPNPHIAFEKYHFKVPTTLQQWPTYTENRLAGISGFGFGGTNAHVVLQNMVQQEEASSSDNQTQTPEIFTLSAKDPLALNQYVQRWLEHLTQNPLSDLAQICYNTHVRRSHYFYKLAIIPDNVAELIAALQKVLVNNLSGNKNIFLYNEQEKTIPKLPAEVTTIDLPTLANLYVKNAKIDWQKREENRSYPQMDMPLYPWQHKDYWPPLSKLQGEAADTNTNHLFNGKSLISPLKIPQFEFKFNNQKIPEIKDTYNILHAGYYFEMITFAINEMYATPVFTAEDIEFSLPIIVPDNTVITVQLVFEVINKKILKFKFYSHTGGKEWKQHVQGNVVLDATAVKNIESLAVIKQRADTNNNATAFYNRVKAMAMPAAGSISWTHHYWCNDHEILCEFEQPLSIIKTDKLQSKIHFAAIDACIQGLFLVLPKQYETPYVASSIKRIKFLGKAAPKLYLYSTLGKIKADGQQYTGSWSLINQNNETLIKCEGLTMTRLGNKTQIENLGDSQLVKIDLSNIPLTERPQYLTNFFVDQIAILFAMPKEDINPQYSLSKMGMDSLLALVLMRVIESLDVTYSLEKILQGPSIAELVDYILAADDKPETVTSVPQDTPWIAYRKKQPTAKTRLFCFPYGGGGASIYRDWQNALPDTIEVCPIQLPGREARLNEAPINNISTLIDTLLENLQSEFTLPFAFFGHSFGALIAFELAKRLRREHLAMPKQLFVSAFPDPRIPTQSLNIMLQKLANKNIDLFALANSSAIKEITNQQLNTIFTIFSDNGITEYNNQVMSKAVIKVLLPIFIGDMSIVKSYQYHDEAPLSLPLTVFLGRNDQWVLPDDHLGWAHHTTVGCKFHEFDSAHLFIKEPHIKQQILNIISDTMIAHPKIQVKNEPIFS